MASYVLGGLVVVVFAWDIWGHVRRWRLGQAEKLTGSWFERAKAFVRFGLFQGRLAVDRYAFGMHLAVFFGMAMLFVGTALATVDQDVTHLMFGFQFLRGNFYLAYKLFLDLFGAGLVVGLGLAFYRRYVLKPERLKNVVYPTFPLDSFYLLAILVLIGTTGLVVEGLRLAAVRVPWSGWSPIGNLLAQVFRQLPAATLQAAHFVFWSLHGLLAFTFIALIPHSKAFHLVSSAVNIFLRNLQPAGALAAAAPAGAAGIGDFTWRQLLQFDACTWCGRCQDQCPAYASGVTLSPKSLVLKLGEELSKAGRRNGQPKAVAPPALHGSVVSAAELWACTTCRACEDICPVFIEQPRAVV